MKYLSGRKNLAIACSFRVNEKQAVVNDDELLMICTGVEQRYAKYNEYVHIKAQEKIKETKELQKSCQSQTSSKK